MIKNVSIISSKGLNPYSATWVSGDAKQEVKSEVKPVSTENVQESKPVQEKADVVQLSTNPASSNADKLSKGAIAAAGASVVLSAAGIIAGRKNVKAASKAAADSTAELKRMLEDIKNSSITPETIKESVKESNKKMVAAIAGALGVAAGGAAGTLVAGSKSKDESVGLDDDALKSLEQAGSAIKNKLESVNGKADFAISKSLSGANAVDGRTEEMRMHSNNYYGLKLLTYCDEGKVVDKTKNALAYNDIRNTAEYYVNRTADKAMADVQQYRKDYGKYLDPKTIWSITAEYEPIKAGGLGVVPKELQDNFTKLGLDNPTFIPMYLSPGKGELKQVFNPERPNDYTYYYKNNAFNVTKFATMPIKKYSGTIPQTQNIEFYVGYVGDKAQKEGKLRPIVFVNDNETFGTDLYNNGMQGSEKIKFAVLDKAVYQLAKHKISESINEVDAAEGKPVNYNTGCSEIVINDKEAYDRIKTPSSMILNDWHAAGIAGLMRYKAPLENAHNEISDTAAVVMKKMPLLMIGHNAGEPGSTNNYDALTENVINTLYDGYAYGITENAASGYYPQSKDDAEYNYSKINNDNYGNAVFFNRNSDRQFNSLAHGLALSDWFVPVSMNYSKELMTGEQGSGTAAGLIEKRARAGKKNINS
ncbi:glycogen/starch synthase [bacterium]|nr:glycogen/starch synthase [bacterium]